MDFAVLVDGAVGHIITLAVGVGIAYMILKNTGVEKKFNELRKEQMKRAHSGWGKENIETLTRLEFLRLFKFGRKENRHLYLGTYKVAKVNKSIDFGFEMNAGKEIPYVAYLVKSGFLGMHKDVYYISKDEITNQTDKGIYIEASNINNYNGVFMTSKYLPNKMDNIRGLADKLKNEDLQGRIVDFASQVVSLDPNHAKTISEIDKRNEAFMMEKAMGEKRLQELV